MFGFPHSHRAELTCTALKAEDSCTNSCRTGKGTVISWISHRLWEMMVGTASSPSGLCVLSSRGHVCGGPPAYWHLQVVAVVHLTSERCQILVLCLWLGILPHTEGPLCLHREQATCFLPLFLCLALFFLSFFLKWGVWGGGIVLFLWLLVISCQIFSLENIVYKLSHTSLFWNGNCTCWKSHATQSFKLRNGVIYNAVIFIVWIYFILSINTSIMLFGRKHIKYTSLVQCRK